MADRITEERLREIVVNGTYCGLDEGHSIAAELLAARADLDEAMLLHGGENGKLPVSMRFPEYLDRIAKLRDRWMARREKHKETP